MPNTYMRAGGGCWGCVRTLYRDAVAFGRWSNWAGSMYTSPSKILHKEAEFSNQDCASRQTVYYSRVKKKQRLESMQQRKTQLEMQLQQLCIIALASQGQINAAIFIMRMWDSITAGHSNSPWDSAPGTGSAQGLSTRFMVSTQHPWQRGMTHVPRPLQGKS